MKSNVEDFEKDIINSLGYQEFIKLKRMYKDSYEALNKLYAPVGNIEIYKDSIIYTEYIERYMPAGEDILEYQASIDFPKKFKHDIYLVSYITRKGHNGDISWNQEYTLIDYDNKLYKVRDAKEFSKKDAKRLVNIRKSYETTKK